MPATEVQIPLPDQGTAQWLAGPNEANLALLEAELGLTAIVRSGALVLAGEDVAVELARRLVTSLLPNMDAGDPLAAPQIRSALDALREDPEASVGAMLSDVVARTHRGKPVRARTMTQKAYVQAIREHTLTFGVGPAGTGKCIRKDSVVLTADGPRRIEDLCSDAGCDEALERAVAIMSLDGPRHTSHVYNGGVKDTLRVTTRQGYEIEGTPEHPLLTIDGGGQPCWIPLREVTPGVRVAIYRGARMFGQEQGIAFTFTRKAHDHSSKPVVATDLTEDWAYLLGLLTGDGCLRVRGRIILSSADPEIRSFFKEFMAALGLHVFHSGKWDMVVGSHALYGLLMHLGLSGDYAHEKFVPQAIDRAPEGQVRAYLQGLFDTDATVDARDGYVSFSTSSERLARQIHLHLLNFGIVARLRQKATTHRDAHMLDVTGKDADLYFDLIGFRLPRKQDRRQVRARNSNVDLVPNVAPVLQAVMEAGVIGRRGDRLMGDYLRGRRLPSQEKLATIIAFLDETRGDHFDQRETLAFMTNPNVFWAEVEHVEADRCQVYDLTVPGDHNFLANGFVNHNTYLAAAMAANALREKQVSKIILTRPAVEAGESLGFLPGDFQAKVDPYFRPLYDAMYEMLDGERFTKYLERGMIEVAPLAYMRGRTLNDAFIILDEAQNTTPEQMKMFLTRIGFGSRVVVTGDETQVDLPRGKRSALQDMEQLLRKVPDVAFVRFAEQDVVRHDLVRRIVQAYAIWERNQDR